MDLPDTGGQTPLAWASNYGRKAVVELLIESFAKVESKVEDGRTPLLEASAWGYEDVVRILLVHCALVDSKDNNVELRYRGRQGEDTMPWYVCY